MAIDINDVFRALGILGFGFYVLNYWLLSSRVLDSESKSFFALNTVAAALVLMSNYVEFNLASVLIQVFWIVIGTLAIIKRSRTNRGLSRH